MNPSAQDLDFMRRALSLAARGAGRVNPNPLVGAVLVRDGRIIGEGYHAYFGGPVSCMRRSYCAPVPRSPA